MLRECIEIGNHLNNGGLIAFFRSEIQQFACICNSCDQGVERHNDILELRSFLTQRLRPIGFIPNVGFFQFAPNLGQTLRLAVIVKDTPLTRSCVPRGFLFSA